jgi:hypothetical protein
VKPKLKLIRGDKKGGGGAPPPPSGRGRSGRGRRPNPLNQLLWYATSRAYYSQRADGVEEVARRMTRLSRRVTGREIRVSTSNASNVIFDCRRRRRFYGWTLEHVEKGRVGNNCGFVPVLMDVDDTDTEIFLIDEADLVYVVSGLKSSIGTIESMVANDADGCSFLIGCLEALGMRRDADRFREFAAECRAFALRAAEIRQHVQTL